MKNEKVYIEGHIIGLFASTLEKIGHKILLANGDVVDIDNSFIHKSIKPEKVTIPQFIADWIEECEEKEKTLLNSLLYTPEGVNSWMGNSDNQELFARAWFDGYEVEKEKRYLVKVKGMKRVNGCLAINKKLAIWFFGTSGNSNNYRTHHTRKELEEANFGWVFDCEGIEIEEVEE